MVNVLFDVVPQLAKSAGFKIVKAVTFETAKKVLLWGAWSALVGSLVYKVDKKNEKEAIHNSFNEGHKAGEEVTIPKIREFIKRQRRRDEFLLLNTKILVHVARCDGEFSAEEMKLLDNFIGRFNDSPVIHPTIKKRIAQIKQTSLVYCDIVAEMEDFLRKYGNENRREIINYVNQLIDEMIHADGYVHPAKQEFIDNWNRDFSKEEQYG